MVANTDSLSGRNIGSAKGKEKCNQNPQRKVYLKPRKKMNKIGGKEYIIIGGFPWVKSM